MSTTLVPLIWLAGAIQIGIIVANAFLPRALGVHESLPRLRPLLRHIFVVHWIYIVLVIAMFAALCLFFAADLAGGSALGRLISASLAIFWSLRIVIQIGWYGDEIRTRFPRAHLVFTGSCACLAAIFTAAALGLGG